MDRPLSTAPGSQRLASFFVQEIDVAGPQTNQRKVESGLEVLYTGVIGKASGTEWLLFCQKHWFGLLLAVQVLTSEVNQNAACGAWTGRLKFVFW